MRRPFHILLFAASIALVALVVAFNLTHLNASRDSSVPYAVHALIAVDALAVLIGACSLTLLLRRER